MGMTIFSAEDLMRVSMLRTATRLESTGDFTIPNWDRQRLINTASRYTGKDYTVFMITQVIDDLSNILERHNYDES
jgi:hypothetical protein